MKDKKRFSFSRLFRNNKFVFVMSLFVAVVIWVLVSLNQNESESVINNIPIQINLSDEAVKNGLEIFSGADQTASVTVRGNRVTLGTITSDDITVSAQTAGTISTPGTYALSLTAKKTTANDNFELLPSVSPSVITIYVDQSKEQTFEVENKLKYTVAKGYHADVTLSPEKIKVKGPKSEVSKIASVGIEGTIGGEIREDKSSEFDVNLYDSSGAQISNGMIKLSETTVTANFSVLPEKEVPIQLAYKNKPSELNIDSFTSISPSKILVCAPRKVLNKLDYISTEEIDFTDLSNKKIKLSLALDLPDKVLNLSDNEKVNATLDLRSYKSKNIRVPNSNFKVIGLDSKYDYSFLTDELYVSVKGPKSQLKKIKASSISCVIDASDIDGTTGSISLPADIKIKDSNYCWVYGKYKVNIYVDSN